MDYIKLKIYYLYKNTYLLLKKEDTRPYVMLTLLQVHYM